jgi:integrase
VKKLLPYVTKKQVRGQTYYYFRLTWTEGGKRKERNIPLPSNPDTQEFTTAYWEIRSGRAPSVAPKVTHTWQELITAYRSHRKYTELKPGTRRKYDPVIEDILEKNAKKDARLTTREQVRAMHAKYAETPRKADHILQVLSLLFNFAKKTIDWNIENPAEGIDLYGPQKEHEPWPLWLQDDWIKACIETKEPRLLTAYYLGTGTGQRPGDLVGMEWSHFDGEYMQVRQDKTDTRLTIYCPQRLRTHLSEIKREGKFILPKNLAQPLSYSALEKDFRRVRLGLGEKALPYSMHGWRYVAAVELAEAGCSDAEIQSVTGHKALEMVQKYRRSAAQKAMSKQAQQRRDRNGTNRE